MLGAGLGRRWGRESPGRRAGGQLGVSDGRVDGAQELLQLVGAGVVDPLAEGHAGAGFAALDVGGCASGGSSFQVLWSEPQFGEAGGVGHLAGPHLQCCEPGDDVWCGERFEVQAAGLVQGLAQLREVCPVHGRDLVVAGRPGVH